MTGTLIIITVLRIKVIGLAKTNQTSNRVFVPNCDECCPVEVYWNELILRREYELQPTQCLTTSGSRKMDTPLKEVSL